MVRYSVCCAQKQLFVGHFSVGHYIPPGLILVRLLQCQTVSHNRTSLVDLSEFYFLLAKHNHQKECQGRADKAFRPHRDAEGWLLCPLRNN